jgi:16S rRNA processing protein RimM
LLEVGRIIKPQGLRGEVVVELFSNRPERVTPGACLHGGATDLRVAAARALPPGRPGSPSRWVVAFVGVAGRDAAEALRDVELSAPPLGDDDGTLWVHEMIGSMVVDGDGVELGQVAAVEANPASDLLVLGDGALVPLRFVVDRRPGQLVVDVPPGLFDLR